MLNCLCSVIYVGLLLLVKEKESKKVPVFSFFSICKKISKLLDKDGMRRNFARRKIIEL